MDQVQRLEKEQKFTNLWEAEIMNISPESSPRTLVQSQKEQKLILSMVIGNTNQETIEIGMVEGTKTSIRNGKTKVDPMDTITETITKNPSLNICERTNMKQVPTAKLPTANTARKK